MKNKFPIDYDLPEGYTRLHTINGESIVIRTHFPSEKIRTYNPNDSYMLLNAETDYEYIQQRINAQLNNTNE